MLIFEHSRTGRRATAQAPVEVSAADDLPTELPATGTGRAGVLSMPSPPAWLLRDSSFSGPPG